jgi:hypothetical protein
MVAAGAPTALAEAVASIATAGARASRRPAAPHGAKYASPAGVYVMRRAAAVRCGDRVAS